MTVDFNLYLITDRIQAAGGELPAVVAAALQGGVRAVQLREKDLPPRRLFELAVVLRRATREQGARLLINDRIDIAMAVDADGVHLGAASLPVAEARRLLGADRLIGYSAHGVDEAVKAEREGADFVTFGPVFPTPSKAAYGAPLGPAALAEAVHSLRIPVFALGGVTPAAVAGIMATGCRGIALISAIIAADRPEKAARGLLDELAAASR